MRTRLNCLGSDMNISKSQNFELDCLPCDGRKALLYKHMGSKKETTARQAIHIKALIKPTSTHPTC